VEQVRRNFTTYLKTPSFWGDVSHGIQREDVTSGGDTAGIDKWAIRLPDFDAATVYRVTKDPFPTAYTATPQSNWLASLADLDVECCDFESSARVSEHLHGN